ncbi:metallophosphoesterase family protein [Paracoccus binzhouensis]|uniref:hypothetical protein n=1 Tax=Paracoccus binzhouensis TaxID=2796149 RepID=UPI001E64EA7E|nr:hypothetical protein [Paracoccus binzhouensis]
MKAAPIERLWEKVEPDDDFWLVGDFAFGPKAKNEDWLRSIFDRLPGTHLVVGKHDGPPIQALPWSACHGWWRWTTPPVTGR